MIFFFHKSMKDYFYNNQWWKFFSTMIKGFSTIIDKRFVFNNHWWKICFQQLVMKYLFSTIKNESFFQKSMIKVFSTILDPRFFQQLMTKGFFFLKQSVFKFIFNKYILNAFFSLRPLFKNHNNIRKCKTCTIYYDLKY